MIVEGTDWETKSAFFEALALLAFHLKIGLIVTLDDGNLNPNPSIKSDLHVFDATLFSVQFPCDYS